MIDYLKKFDITSAEIEELKLTLHNEILLNLEVMQNNVIEVLIFLKEFGVNNLYNIIKERPDLCLKDKNDLERDLTVLDKNLLIYIFDNDIDDLINFRI